MPTMPWLAARLGRWSEVALTPRLIVAGAEVAVPLGLLVLCAMTLALGTYNPFLYFRF